MKDFFPIPRVASNDSLPAHDKHPRDPPAPTGSAIPVGLSCWLTRPWPAQDRRKGRPSAPQPVRRQARPFFLDEISYTLSRKSDLHACAKWSSSSHSTACATDFLRTQLAAYFVELIELVTEPEHPVPELFDLLLRALALSRYRSSQISRAAPFRKRTRAPPWHPRSGRRDAHRSHRPRL